MESSVLFSAIIVIVFVKILQNYFLNVFNYWQKRGVNGPVPLPIFGNFITTLLKPANEFEEQRLLKYGRVYGTFEFSTPMLTIAEPALIREVTIKQFHKFQNRYNRLKGDKFLSISMFFSTDETWKRLRSYLSPVFTSKKMKTMFRSVEQCSENTMQYIRSIEGKEVIIKNTMLSFTMDVIAKSVFGVNTNGYKDPNNEFLIKAQKFANVSIWRVLGSTIIPRKIQELHKFLEFQVADQNSMNYFKKVLSKIIADRKNSEIKRNDFVSLMLSLEEIEEEDEEESNESLLNDIMDTTNKLKYINGNVSRNEKKMLTNDEILAQAFMFFVAGYETTSTLLNFALYSLAVNPEVQERLYNEIVKYCGHKDQLNFDTVHSMTYLDAFINESLRMYPPIVVLDRVASEDIVLGDDNIKIDKGTVVNLPFYAIHHDPVFFPDPHTFKPERFLAENKQFIEPYTFIPFGSGPRYCIGMRFAIMAAKTFIINLLRNFQVVKTKNTASKPKYIIVLGLLASEPLFVSFVPRK